MKLARHGLLACALAGLAACAGAGSVHDFLASPQYSTGHVAAASQGETLVVVRNNPFPADRDSAGVVAAMRGQHFGPNLNLTTATRANAPQDYKIVLAFGGAPGGNPCTDTASAPQPATRVNAAFCVRDFMLTRVSGHADAFTGPNDPAFRGLMGQVMAALLPNKDPFERSENCHMLPNC